MGKPFERIITVMFENQYRNYVLQNKFMRKLASAGANMSSFSGVFHPSQPNYIASICGEVCAITNDTSPAAPLEQKNLVDLLEEANVSWKAYMEGYPGEAWKTEWQNPVYSEDLQPIVEYPEEEDGKLAGYFRKHNAFASMHSVQKDENRWKKIVSDEQFWRDVEGENLPQYSWFTPDIWNDGHYIHGTHWETHPRWGLIPQVATWLEFVFFGHLTAGMVAGGTEMGVERVGLNLDFDLLLEDPQAAWAKSNVPKGTLIVVTFDEADFNADGLDTMYDGPNQVYTVLLGDMIEPGTVIDAPYNHYSLLKTIQKNFGLNSLGKNDKDANWLRFLWKEEFKWRRPISTGLKAQDALALASLNGQFHLIYQESNGTIFQAPFVNRRWADATNTGLNANGHLGLASLDKTLHLVYTDVDGALMTSTSSDGDAWSTPAKLGFTTQGHLALCAYTDEDDQKQKMMLCWQGEQGFIQYTIYADGAWQKTASDVGQLTDGRMALSQLGPSLYLVYKERNSRKMRMTSFNLADYNQFKATSFEGDKHKKVNDTAIHKWAPADKLVGNFSSTYSHLSNGYRAFGGMAMASIEGEMHLIHRGGFKDRPSAYTECFGLTGILTPDDYRTNGYGTLEQAGWTEEQKMAAIKLDTKSSIAMASDGERLMVVWRAWQSDELKYLSGGYVQQR